MKIKTIVRRLLLSSLKKQLVFSFMLVSMIVIAVNSWITFNTNMRMLSDIVKRNSVQSFSQMEQNIDDFFFEVDNMAKILLTNKVIYDYMNIENNSELSRTYLFSDFAQVTSNFFAIYKQIDSIFIIKSRADFMGNSRINSWNIKGDNDSTDFFSNFNLSEFQNSPSVSMFISNTSTDFFLNSKDFANNRKYNFITVARKIIPITGMKKDSIMLVNVYENNLKNIYKKLIGKDNSIFIVDKKGIVISHSDSGKIGRKAAEYQYFNKDAKDGAITFKGSEGTFKVIYYKLDKTGWFIVNRIPINEFQKNTVSMQNVIFILTFSSLLLIFILYSKWLSRIMIPFFNLVKVMKNLEEGQLGVTCPDAPDNEIGTIISQFNKMSVSIKNLIENNKINEEQKRILEIEFLQSQINPHFLYNTLNAIKWMAAIIKAKKIVDAITILGNMIRPIFKQPEIYWTLKEEIRYIENFIKIMCYRYDEYISLRVESTEELSSFRVLRFILQPLVENSLIHGFTQMTGDKMILIRVEKEDDMLIISVIDNGKGISNGIMENMNMSFSDMNSAESELQVGIGMYNTNKRIKLHYGDQYGIRIFSNEVSGASVVIRIPFDKDK